LLYGAASTDSIVLLYPGNPSTKVGTPAVHPVTVEVLAADGVTPVSGATIGWSATNSLQLSACGGTSSCAVTTDQNGAATSFLTPGAAGVAIASATLAPGIYSPAKSVNATLNATQTSSDIGVATPFLSISQGATIRLPLTVRALSNGVPRGNVQVNFTIVSGSGNLSAASAQTNSTGYATVNLSVVQIAAEVQISACVAPGNVPCGTFNLFAVPLSRQYLQPVAGAGQVSTSNILQPVIVRVVDDALPPNPVIGAPVVFMMTVLRPGGTSSDGNGETQSVNPAMPVILQATQSSATTDSNGLASTIPSGSGFSPPVEVNVGVSAGVNVLDYSLQILPVLTRGGISAETSPSFAPRAPARVILAPDL
jgi:hypothetical protein